MSASHLLLTDTNAKPFLNVPTRHYHRHQQKLSCTRQAILRDGSEKRDRAEHREESVANFLPSSLSSYGTEGGVPRFWALGAPHQNQVSVIGLPIYLAAAAFALAPCSPCLISSRRF